MRARWVCKRSADGEEASFEKVRKELTTIIGAENILRMEMRSDSAAERLEEVTAGLVAFEITDEGWVILTQGFSGPQGFELCDEQSEH